MSEEQQEKKSEQPVEKKPEERVHVRDVTGAAAVKDAQGLVTTRSFFVEAKLDDGSSVSGQFTCKRLTIGDLIRIGALRARLVQEIPPLSLDSETWQFSEWVALCTVALIEKPTWFDYNAMYDTLPLQKVYEEVTRFHDSFRKAVGK